ncbi:MAG: hypothetical protein WDO74_03095 [Pseudomonadota bacterium]
MIVSAACGSGGKAGDHGTGGDDDAAVQGATCEDMVHANCAWQVRCDTTGTVKLDACLEANAGACAWYKLPGVAVGSADFRACVTKYDAGACGVPIGCSFPAGTNGPDAPCASDLGCTTRLCYQISPDSCGSCAIDGRHTAGGACTSAQDCLGALDCVGGVCTEWVQQEGAACGGNRTCAFKIPGKEGSLRCIDGACKLVVAGRGEACYTDGQGAYYCNAGLICSFLNTTCVPIRYDVPGTLCGGFADEYVFCRGMCMPNDSTGVQGTCIRLPGAGESCHAVSSFEQCADGFTCDSHDTCVLKQTLAPQAKCP